jgi:hypothetical protein
MVKRRCRPGRQIWRLLFGHVARNLSVASREGPMRFAAPLITLSGPAGADSVDPWRTITDSLQWT